MSENFKDVLALAIGTVLMMLVWLTILSGSRVEEFAQDTKAYVSEALPGEVAIHPAPAIAEAPQGVSRRTR
jgi:hypothetical protein